MIVVCGKDKFWCCGLNVNLARLTIPAEFTGQNMLGQLLQELREYIRGLDASEMLSVLNDLRENERDDVERNEQMLSPHTVRELCDVAKCVIQA